MNSNVVVLQNVTLKWAFLSKPQTEGPYASGRYQVNIVMSDEDKKKLESYDIASQQKFRKTEEGLWEICVKSKNKPTVKDAHKNALSDELIQKIGNGSTAVVALNIFEMRGKNFIGLNGIILRKLVEYTGSSPLDSIEIEGVEEAVPFDTEDEVLS